MSCLLIHVHRTFLATMFEFDSREAAAAFHATYAENPRLRPAPLRPNLPGTDYVDDFFKDIWLFLDNPAGAPLSLTKDLAAAFGPSA